MSRFPVPQKVRQKALASGPEGQAWLDGLADMLSELAERWELTLGGTLTGGTEALVVEATLPDGREAVLKLGVPGREPVLREPKILLLARGRGYAEVYRHDPTRDAILLEKLGAPLATSGMSLDDQLRTLCAALKEAWLPVPARTRDFPTGTEKARFLASFVEATWTELARPFPEKIIEVVRRLAKQRCESFDPNNAVLAHGDAHPWNLLAHRNNPRQFKFIDPEGLVIEPAYDVGTLMREWTDELLAGDPVKLGLQRRDRLAELTGVDSRAIWQWGFLECVSTGLLCNKLGLDEGRNLLVIAEAWAEACGH